MPSFAIPLSGLNADSTALNTIANNLANMNTTGYKNQVTSFSSMLYQAVGSSGSGNPIQVGTGVQVAGNSTDFSTGNITATGAVYSDAAINGSGFFVLNHGMGGQVVTRDGNFFVAKDGTLESADGLAVMGYNAVNGVVNTSGTVSNIVIPMGQTMAAKATSSFSVGQNLQAGSTSPATSTVTLYDSLGNAQTATIAYTPSTTKPNEWDYQITLGDSGCTLTGDTGTLEFDSNGNLITTGTTDTNVPPITISGLSDNAGTMNLTWNITGANSQGTITQNATASSQSSQDQDGYVAGEYGGTFSIASDGTITAKYSNGQVQTLAQIAVATVNNEQGLSGVGNSEYETTAASGNLSIGVAGTGGRGSIEGGELEASNVNISAEFSNLIIAQRAFEANSKAVTTFDTVTQETINMIH
jgi:flagellar hook protein FlgE